MKKSIAQDKIRDIAIIAHVDHGKTTLIDAFIKQSMIFRENEEEMGQTQILDFNELERERGITIQAKNISIPYKDYKINIIDTPGHADFCGEVERTLNMADGCLLLVDAQEGVMPQTKFVLKKAMQLKLKPIVVVNKIDKKLADAEATVRKVQDLFLELATDSAQLDFKVFYAIGRLGKVFVTLPTQKGDELTALEADVKPLLEEIIETVPYPTGDPTLPLLMQVSSVDYDEHHGRYIIGKIMRGVVKLGEDLVSVSHKDSSETKKRVKKLFVREGMKYAEVDEASVGEIVAIAGFGDTTIGDTICSPDKIEALPNIEITPPSLKIKFEANTSPFLGKEGKYANLKQLQARLDYEAEINVGLEISKTSDGSYSVAGRGELHLGILIETLRREGYEFQVRKPEVILKEIDGKKMEPMEELYVEFPEEYYGVVTQEVSLRKAEMINTERFNGNASVTYHIRTRNLLGLRRVLLTATKGNIIMSNHFAEYVKWEESIKMARSGRLVSSASGKALAYALNSIQERGELLITPNTDVYEGMIIGVNKYEDDIDVNPLKAREKTNVRMSHAVVTEIMLKSPIQLTLEYAISFLSDNEILEVTPKNLRLRRRYLTKQEEYNAIKRLKRN